MAQASAATCWHSIGMGLAWGWNGWHRRCEDALSATQGPVVLAALALETCALTWSTSAWSMSMVRGCPGSTSMPLLASSSCAVTQSVFEKSGGLMLLLAGVRSERKAKGGLCKLTDGIAGCVWYENSWALALYTACCACSVAARSSPRCKVGVGKAKVAFQRQRRNVDPTLSKGVAVSPC